MQSTQDLTRLYRDDELDLLLMRRGSADATASARGLWLRKGRKQLMLGWDEVASLDLKAFGALGRVELLRSSGATHSVGPFAMDAAVQWLEAARDYALDYGANPTGPDSDGSFVVWAPRSGASAAA